MNNRGRKDWLDALRGIAITMVLLVHIIPNKTHEWYVYNVFVGPIMIPMFFVISGYLFNSRNGNQGVFFKNLGLKLIMPSFLLFGGLQLLRIPFSGVQTFCNSIAQFISGKTYWYITACIVAEILFFYNLKFSPTPVFVYLTSFVCCAIGFLMDHFGIGNFAMINRAFIAQLFLGIGYLFKHNEFTFRRVRWPMIMLGGLAYLAMIAGTFVFWPQQSIDVHLNRYYSIPYCFTLIILACLCLMTAASKLERMPKALAVIGRHTLVIYLFHSYCVSIATKVLPVRNTTGAFMLMKSVLITAFALAVCITIGVVINHFFPWVMGRRRTK